MPREYKEITTKTGFTIRESWCRKCASMRPASEFYEASDLGLVDSNGLQSVCKSCIQELYEKFYEDTQSMEKAIHRLCIILNITYSNEAVSAARAHINTLIESGKSVSVIFGIYKQKLVAINPSMDKSIEQDLSYQDVGTIYVEKEIKVKEIPIPQEVIDFWGRDVAREDILYLEGEYTNFKKTHKADSYAEIVLLKEVCYTLLEIKAMRRNGDDPEDAIKRLQSLMKNLAISPNATNASGASKDSASFGMWIQDIEREEPAQWLKRDPRGDIYRDVGNVEEYFQKYFVRPLKNFILGSKDFNLDSEQDGNDEYELEPDERADFKYIDDGEV